MASGGNSSPPDLPVLPIVSHGAIVIPNNSLLESLATFALVFLVGICWGHFRSCGRETAPKGHTL